MDFRIVNSLPEEEWRCFVVHHPESNIFHAPEMFQVFARAKGFHPTLWAAVGNDDRVEALFLPVQVTLSESLRPLTTRSICYGSVLCSPSKAGHEALSMLLRTYVQENKRTCLFTELRNISSLKDEQALLQKQGFAFEEYLNYLIDLRGSPEDVFLNIGPRTRKNLKRAINRRDLAIREAVGPEEIRVAYGLLSKTYEAARVPLADLSLFDEAFELLHAKGMIRFALAYVGSAPAAVSVDLMYKDVIYGWYAGMDRGFSKYVPNDLLMWDVLKWGSEHCFSSYDFGGAGRPEEQYGVRDFKAKFGGKLVCYGRNTYVHRPGFLWLSKQGYRVARHLLKGRI